MKVNCKVNEKRAGNLLVDLFDHPLLAGDPSTLTLTPPHPNAETNISAGTGRHRAVELGLS